MAPRVILAHDVHCDASSVAQVLVRHGYETRRVHDGEGLIALAESWQPGAAVIELGLRERPALAAGSALRERFGGEIQIVGVTIPSAPQLEHAALNAGFDHVVVDSADASDILLSLGGPGAALVRRAQGAALMFANTLADTAQLRLAGHASIANAEVRRRNIAQLRRVIQALGQCVANDVFDDAHRARMRLRLASIEADFEQLVRNED